MIEDVRITDGILGIGRRWGIALLLGIDGRDVCSRVSMSRGLTRLLAVPDEVFEVLYGRHVGWEGIQEEAREWARGCSGSWWCSGDLKGWHNHQPEW